VFLRVLFFDGPQKGGLDDGVRTGDSELTGPEGIGEGIGAMRPETTGAGATGVGMTEAAWTGGDHRNGS